MPAPDGIETLKTLKSNKTLKDIPVVMFTADGNIETVQMVKKLGAAGYILKPLQPDALYKKVGFYVNKFCEKPQSVQKKKSGEPHWITEKDINQKSKKGFDIKSINESIKDIETSIRKINIGVQRSESFEKLFETVLKTGVKITDSNAAAGYMKSSDTSDFELVHSINIDEDILQLFFNDSKQKLLQLLSIKNKSVHLYRSPDKDGLWLVTAVYSFDQDIKGIILFKWEDNDYVFTAEQETLLNLLVLPFTSLMNATEQKKIADHALMGISKALASALDAKDPYSQGHTERVTLYGMTISSMAERYLPEYYIQPDKMQLAGLLHDIGKIGIPDNVLGDIFFKYHGYIQRG